MSAPTGPPSGPPSGATGPPSGPPSGPPAGAAGAAGPSSGKPSPTVIGLIALLLLALVGGGLAVALSGGDDTNEATSQPEKITPIAVRREPVATAGENPFMESVSTDETPAAALTPPPDTGGEFDGATPGLYGGTQDTGSCDPAAMVAFLEANPDKARAWADVFGIRTDEIADYVAGLTSVVLRSDTAVTNHGFSNGRATTIPAVLQAGTAVLVDKYGIPRVKCYCGNPLTEPQQKKVTYTGTPWTDFRPADITYVDPSPKVIVIIVLVDPATNDAFGRPVGTNGEDDGPVPDDPTAPTTLPAIPTNATYSGTLSGSCEGAPSDNAVTITVADGTLTMTGADAGSFSVPVGPGGTFTITGGGDTLTGTFDNEGISGTLTGVCTGSLTGTRTG
jgi:hypothetical protein